MHKVLLPSSRLTRLRNSYRFPLQASLAARMPVIGRRVPIREYWRRQPLQVMRPAEEYLGRLFDGGSRGARFCSMMARGSVGGARRTARGMARPDVRAVPLLIAGAAAGLGAMYYLDPGQGRRRRALMRDRFAHFGHVLTRDIPDTLERRGRFMRGVARGIRHDAAELVGINGHKEFVDDETLVARVRSEVLRDDRFKAGEIHIDAYEGCVTLRGQLDPPDIRRLVETTKHVEGVSEVRSYLHPPGTLPPNKAESYIGVPAHMRAG